MSRPLLRRYGWLFAAVAMLALWAWSQRVATPQPEPSAPDVVADVGQRSPSTDPAHSTGDASNAGRSDRRDHSTPAWLPAEASETLDRIERGGPFAHRQDGATFQNRERRLPAQPRGYYREYTVRTPGARDRGARRIIAGGTPPIEFFYTDDHYRSFRRFTAQTASP